MATLTELGYARWKEDPRTVASARTLATAAIARRRLLALVVAALMPAVAWLDRRLG